MATRKRKANTALVLNPAGRSLSIGGSRRTSNPARRRRRKTTSASRRRRNPIAAQALTRTRRRSNPARRRSNPATTSGLLVAAVMAGIGVSLFDLLTTKFVPQNSALVRAGVKLGGAYLFQSKLGNSIPVLGKFKNDIALVLAVLGVVDLAKLYVFPMIANAAGNFGLLIPAPVEGDETTGNIYGNAYNPNYMYS